MKKYVMLLLAICLLTGTALAEPAQMTLPPFESMNLPENAWIENIAPMSEGGFVASGYVEHRGVEMEWTDPTHSYDKTPYETEAFARRYGAEGNEMWSKQFANKRAIHSIRQAWPMADGRVVLRHAQQYVVPDNLYHLVAADGTVETLPTEKLTAAGDILPSLTRVKDGYLGGMFKLEDGVIMWMEPGDAIVKLDDDLKVLWRLEDERLDNDMFNSGLLELADGGYLLYGSIYTGEANIYSYTDKMIKLSKDGKIAWEFTCSEFANMPMRQAWALADGSVVFIGYSAPLDPTPMDTKDKAVLTRLDKDGNLKWTRAYEDHMIRIFENFVPFGDGFLALVGLGTEEGEWTHGQALVYINADWEIEGYADVPKNGEPNDNLMIYSMLYGGTGDRAYVTRVTIDIDEETREGTTRVFEVMEVRPGDLGV